MRRLPWHVAVRADRKAILTALGVSLGVAFAFGGYTIPERLETETISPEGSFAVHDVLVASASGGRFDPSSLGIENATRVLLVPGADASGAPLTLAALEGPLAPAAEPGVARVVEDRTGSIVLALPSPRVFPLGEPIDSSYVGGGWVVLTRSDLQSLDASIAQNDASYVLAQLDAPAAADLRARGFIVEGVPGVDPFFQASSNEIVRDLALVTLFSSVLVTIFTYEFFRSEVREKRREIGLWRAVGMRANDVVLLLLARAAAIALAGIAVGFALAVLALGLAARMTGSGIFAFQLEPVTGIVLVLAFLASGLAGAFVPSWRASRATIRSQMEAAP